MINPELAPNWVKISLFYLTWTGHPTPEKWIKTNSMQSPKILTRGVTLPKLLMINPDLAPNGWKLGYSVFD